MFIKETQRKNKGYDQVFISHRLVESYRTENGPRQRTILSLGKLDLPKSQWTILSNRIEEIIYGQTSLISVSENIDQLAQHYAFLIIRDELLKRRSINVSEPNYATVDLNSLQNIQSRTMGAEYVGLSMFKALGLPKLLRELGFSSDQINGAILAIVGKLVHPSSEKQTREWAQHISGLDELLNTNFQHLSNNALYRVSDLLFKHKSAIEKHLRGTERELFSLKEKIILYDLTNTYFEGAAGQNPKARRGRSKDKQKGRPLLTLGLVIDELGFPKTSQIFKGNASEPETLLKMLELLQGKHIEEVSESKSAKEKKGITVLLDAGIAIEGNLTLLKSEGYDYICVARNQPVAWSEIDKDNLLTIKENKNNKVEVSLFKTDQEHILYCKSLAKGKKENAMKTLFQERFEAELKKITASLSKKGGTKKYDKVLERIGRSKEKYATIAQYYRIEVTRKGSIATSIKWSFEKEEKADQRFSGSYFLRTSRTDLDEKELWALYITLTTVEDAFRSLKSELALRPVYHQKKDRADAHLFITLLAYHLLNTIAVKLRQHNIYMRWNRIREFLSTHVRITTAIKEKNGKQIYIRNSSVAEPFHRAIYNALNLSHIPLQQKRISKLKIRSAHTNSRNPDK